MSTMKEYTYVVEQDEEGWFVGSVPSLPGCHTQARTTEELHVRIKEAIELYVEAVGESPKTQFIAVEKVAV
jgi:predicted RNase H-like HicB family nuclease